MTIRPKLGVTLIFRFIIFLIEPIFCLRTAFIFRPLQLYRYISYTIFIEVLLLYFVRYIHGYMKSMLNIAAIRSTWSYMELGHKVIRENNQEIHHCNGSYKSQKRSRIL